MKLFLIIASLTLAATFNSFAQTQDELEKKKDALVKEIDDLQNELSQTQKSKNVNLNDVTTLKQKINARQKLINNYNASIGQINKDINGKIVQVRALDKNLDALKDNYAKMVYYAYKHRSAYDRLLFLFSANSFNDALIRLKYMKRYNAYRRMQAETIHSNKDELQKRMDELQKQRADKKQMLTDEENQKKKLASEKAEKDKMLKTLTKQEKNLKSNIDKKKKEQEALKKQIADLIKKEIEAQKKKTTTTTTNSAGKTTTTTSMELTPEAKALSASFESNMGKLPWPVEKGYVIEQFGTHPHAELENVMVKNNGIDIKTSQGASVRAVFKGTVVSILTNPGYHKAVLVKHGEYFTVYSNLGSVNVKANQTIDTKQVIGSAFTDDATGISSVHLEIWKGIVLLDPEAWLVAK